MTLHELLAELREEIAAESPLALHSYSASEKAGEDGEADEGGIGRPMTAAMHRLLKHPDHWEGMFLGRASILEVAEWCNARHPEHRIPLSSKSVCQLLVEITAVRGHTLLYAAFVTATPARETEGYLLQALKHAKDWRHRELHKAIARIEGERAIIRCALCPPEGSVAA